MSDLPAMRDAIRRQRRARRLSKATYIIAIPLAALVPMPLFLNAAGLFLLLVLSDKVYARRRRAIRRDYALARMRGE